MTTQFIKNSICSLFHFRVNAGGRLIGKLIVLVGLVLSLTIAVVASLIHWPPGALDPTFGGDGKVTTVFPGGDAAAYTLAIQSDGKIMAAGIADDVLALSRYNSDGSLDATFGVGGKVTTDFAIAGLGLAPALAFESDGKIVAAAAAADDAIVVARFNANGSLDTTFGTGGGVTTDVTLGTDLPFAVAIQADGKPIVAGGSYARMAFIVRYNPDGTLDSTFDGDGIVEEPESVYQALAIQPDGKIVAAGYDIFFFGGTGSVVARYNANGSFDTYVSTVFAEGHDKQASALAIQSDGKIVTAVLDFGPTNDVPPPPPPPGSTPTPCISGHFTLVRSNTDGSLDTTFGTGGRVTTDFPGTCKGANALAIQPDGKIVAAEGGGPFALARYNTDGSLDTTFGTGGKVTTDFSGLIATAHALAIDSDGKIVAAGNAGGAFALARYEGQASWACPQGLGYWKNNPDAWPVNNLTLGSQNYSQTELLIILNTPIRSDASLILAHQLIAAKLNIANVSDPAPVSTTVTAADGLLSAFSGKLPYDVRPSSGNGQSMVNDADTLSSYNNGSLTPDCTP